MARPKPVWHRVVASVSKAVPERARAVGLQPGHLGVVRELGEAVRVPHPVLPRREAREERRPRRRARHGRAAVLGKHMRVRGQARMVRQPARAKGGPARSFKAARS
jgi:hypothetical protein